MATPILEQPTARSDEPPESPESPAAPRSSESDPQRVRIPRFNSESIWSLLAAGFGAIALVWVLDQRVLPLSGALGFWLLCYATFLMLYGMVGWAQWPLRMVSDRLVSVILASVAMLVVVAVGDQVVFILARGVKAIGHTNFWTRTMSVTGPLDPLTSGGMVHALVGSLEQLGLATLFSVPLGLLAALYLTEVDDWLARTVRVIVEAMTALPEIIAGLFIYVLVILTFGVERSGFAASLALTVMMIPIVTRTAEVVFRLVPAPLREASYALGSSQFRTVWNVVVPTARSGLATAVILAMARAVGETSPVLLTAGFTKELNANPFNGSQASLPLYIYNYVRYPEPTMVSRAFGAGLALMIMVLILFVLARIVGGRAPGELTARQRRRINQDSSEPTDQLRADVGAPNGQIPTFIAPGYPDPV